MSHPHRRLTSLPLPSALTSAPTAPVPRDLFRTFPLLKFYRGFTVSLAGIIPVRRHRVPHAGIPARHPSLCRGGRRDAFGRSQVGGLTQPGRWLRWGETVRAIWMRGGVRGFFVGLGIGYLKRPMNAVGFAVW